MAGFNLSSPPSTRDPEKLCTYLHQLYETLNFVLQNIDTDNMSDDLYQRVAALESAVGIKKEDV